MTALQPPVEDLLRQAAEWRLIGLLLECPTGGWQGRIEELAGEVSDTDLDEAVLLSREQASEGLYHSTFGPGGPAPPREAAHRDMLQLGYLLAELETYYASFGYHPASLEPPDHVSVEAGFVAYLKLKEAFALASGDSEAAGIAAQACRDFSVEHLASVAAPLAAALTRSGVGYLNAVGRVLLRRTGPARQRFVVLGAEHVDADEDPFGCGDALVPPGVEPSPL